MQTADQIATASLFVAAVAAGVSVYAIYKGNRNSSVATIVALNQAWGEAWKTFLSSTNDDDKFLYLAELLNLMEIASGIQVEGSLYGMSRDILVQYLNESLGLLIKNSYTNATIAEMFSAPTTFRNIKRFLKLKPKYLSVTVPPKWFEQLDM